MRDILLIIPIMLMVILGVFTMKRLDKFLEKNRELIENEELEKNNNCLIFENLSDEEILKKINEFKREHKKVKIFVYDAEDEYLDNKIENYKNNNSFINKK